MDKIFNHNYKSFLKGFIFTTLSFIGAFLLLSLLIYFTSNDLFDINEILISFTSSLLGGYAIMFLVLGCLSCQDMRMYVNFGKSRRDTYFLILRNIILPYLTTIFLGAIIHLIVTGITKQNEFTITSYLINALILHIFVFSIGMLFSALTSLFKPLFSGIIIAFICFLYLKLTNRFDIIHDLENGSKLILVINSILTIVCFVATYLIYTNKHSDLKTTT